MRRLAFCFDGTWNKIDGENPTNVARIAQSISRIDDDNVPQLIYYDEGVGTTRTERWSGGVFGHGLREKVIHAYHQLVLNYEPGDELFVFGFSRGAFSARSFVGLLRNCGIMSRRSLHHIREAVQMYLGRTQSDHPNSESARLFRLQHCPRLCLPGDREWRKEIDPDLDPNQMTDLRVKYLGIWDTVGALGIPQHIPILSRVNRRYQFHDTNLSSFVLKARHAISADERRKSFSPSIWTNLDDLNQAHGDDPPYEQLIFPGVHSAVGGGGPVRGLSDAALEWVFAGARQQQLHFDVDAQSPIFQLQPDHRAQLFNETGKLKWSIMDRLMGAGLSDRDFPKFDRRALHESVVRRYAEQAERLPEKRAYRPPALKSLWTAMDEMAAQMQENLVAAEEAVAAQGDDRALLAPLRVVDYVVKQGDTLNSIAKDQMGSESDAEILALHNRTVGNLFEDLRLYAGVTIQIPVYNDPSIPAGSPAPAEPAQTETKGGSTTQ